MRTQNDDDVLARLMAARDPAVTALAASDAETQRALREQLKADETYPPNVVPITKARGRKRAAAWLPGVFVAAAAVAGAIVVVPLVQNTAAPTSPATGLSPTESPVTEPTPTPTTTPTPTLTPTPSDSPSVEPEVSAPVVVETDAPIDENQQALQTAQQLIADGWEQTSAPWTTPVSLEYAMAGARNGLGPFSEEAGRYAVENVDVDWNQGALALAQDQSIMSEANIRWVLEMDRFTPEQIVYAMNNVEADYYENALHYAYVAMSPSVGDGAITDKDAIYDYLVNFQHFAPEQAQYAIENMEDEIPEGWTTEN